MCLPFFSGVIGRWFCVVALFQWSDQKVVLCGYPSMCLDPHLK